jgi:hypothetical protein
MKANVIPLIIDTVPMNDAPLPYADQGFDGDAATAEWLLLQASRMDGAIQQGWKLRLAQGEILTQVRNRVPGFFDRWLNAHWPDMSRKTVSRLMSTWENRDALTPFMDDGVDSSRVTNSLSAAAVYGLAEGGAIQEVIDEVLRILKEGGHVGPGDVARLNRQAKAKRSGAPAPREPQPAEALALGLLRKAEPDQIAPAIELLRLAEVVTPEQVMAEQRLRELGKQRFIAGADADFHRMKDGRWIRLPHAGRVDVAPAPEPPPAEPEPAPDDSGRVMPLDAAAQILGLKSSSLRQMLTPSKSPSGLIRHGFRITRAGRGFVRLVQVP